MNKFDFSVVCSLCVECRRGAITSEWNWPLVNWPVRWIYVLMTCLSVPRSVYGYSGVSQGYLCFVVWTQKSRHIIIWLKSTVYYDYRNLQLKLISLVLIVSLCNGHVYADVIPICRSINVLWIKTISISKV